MLKLSRKEGESILIGDNIKVTIQQTKRESVIIGIDAPEDVRILKEEVYFQDRDEIEPIQDRNTIWRNVLSQLPIDQQ